MNRCETFPALSISSLVFRVKRAGLLIVVEEDAQEIQVQVVGTDKDAGTFQFLLSEGRLSVVQPRQAKAGANLQVVVSLPPDWKGALEASTVSGEIIARGVTGTDLSLKNLSGSIRAERLTGITISLKTSGGEIVANDLEGTDLSLKATCKGVTAERLTGACIALGSAFGRMKVCDLAGERCLLHTVTGAISLTECGFASCQLRTVTGAATLDLVSPFDMLEGRSFTGCISIAAPVDRADVSLRSLAGRLLTEGVSISPGAPGVHVRSFTGNLQLNRSLSEQAATI